MSATLHVLSAWSPVFGYYIELHGAIKMWEQHSIDQPLAMGLCRWPSVLAITKFVLATFSYLTSASCRLPLNKLPLQVPFPLMNPLLPAFPTIITWNLSKTINLNKGIILIWSHQHKLTQTLFKQKIGISYMKLNN